MGQPDLDYSPGYDRLGGPAGEKYPKPDEEASRARIRENLVQRRAQALDVQINAKAVTVTASIEEDGPMMGPRARAIVVEILPEFVEKFIAASSHYGDDNAGVLGVRGQFADIWRKIGPLKRALWEGEELTREQPREILMDLIGHCLLTIEMLDRAEREADLYEELKASKRNAPGYGV